MKKSFSILIPSWNNLEYLKTCVLSIEKNSKFKHQILIHVNDGSDGTLDWVKNSQYQFTQSPSNIGICWPLNSLSQFITEDYVLFMNDDMYVCPNWDLVLFDEIEKIKEKSFMLSSTMIEPKSENRDSVVILADFGTDIKTFKEQNLLDSYSLYQKSDWSGSCWPPSVVKKADWFACGMYSTEFSPGMYSDPDFAMKMWQLGCRYFKGLSASRVYHFQSKSTGKVKKNDGQTQFLLKWGVRSSTFVKYYLHRGEPFMGDLKEVNLRSTLKFERNRTKIKILFYSLKNMYKNVYDIRQK